jgi:hypothetical protein
MKVLTMQDGVLHLRVYRRSTDGSGFTSCEVYALENQRFNRQGVEWLEDQPQTLPPGARRVRIGDHEFLTLDTVPEPETEFLASISAA